MQSTGHSSMHDLSSTSTHGCAMMYVTSELPFRHDPGSRSQYRCTRQRSCARLRKGGLHPGGIAGYQLAITSPRPAAALSWVQPAEPDVIRHWNPSYRTVWM